MCAFKSAELKAAAEELWALGVGLSASEIARLFRTGELASLVVAASTISAAIAHWAARVADLQGQLDRAKQAEDAARHRLWNIGHQRMAIASNLAFVSRDADSLASRISSLDFRIWSVGQSIAGIESEIRGHASRISDLQRQQRAAVGDRVLWRRLEEQIRELERLIAAAEGRLNAALAERASLESERARLINTRDQLLATAASLAQQLRSLDSEAAELRLLLGQLESNVMYLARQLAQAQQSLLDLRARWRALGLGP